MLPSDEPATESSAEAPSMPQTVKVEKTLGLPAIGFCVTQGEAATTLFVGMSDFAVHRIDMAAEKIEAVPISPERHNSYVTGLVRAGDRLVSGGYDGALIWWDMVSGEVVRRVETAHSKWVRMLAVSPDASRIASVADDMATRLWDAASGDLIATWGDYEAKTPHGFPSMLYAVAFSPDGRWLATGDKTGIVLVRDLATGEIAARIETPVMYTWDPKARRHSIGGIRSLAFSNDSAMLAVGGMGKVGNIDHLEGSSRVEVFRWQDNVRLHEIEDNKMKGLVEALRFAPGDAWLAAAGGDNSGFVTIYRMDNGKLAAQEKVGSHVHDFVFGDSPDTLYVVGHNQAAMVKLG
jgi:WD40 repeat protein